jgi:DNA invertase Pin-like site-specific DNA recombinase
MLHLLGAFAEFEKEIIRERVKAGVAHARAKGKRLGRRPLIDKKLLGTVRDMKGSGMSIRGISRELGVSKSLVHKSLQI